jgi:hypothetical protein
MRGDLYRLKAPRGTRGHEQAGQRYAVVVQSDDLPLYYMGGGSHVDRPARRLVPP